MNLFIPVIVIRINKYKVIIMHLESTVAYLSQFLKVYNFLT